MKEEIMKMYAENIPFSVGTMVGSSVYHNNAVVSPQDYTFEEYWSLVVGDEIPTGEVDEFGREVYEFMEED